MDKLYIITETAYKDLDEIYIYIEKESPQNAHALLGDLYDKFLSLALNPGTGRLRNDLGDGLRSFVVKKHVLIYSYLTKPIT